MFPERFEIIRKFIFPALAGIGVIAILLLLIGIGMRFTPASRFFASVLTPSRLTESIVVRVEPSEIASGDTFYVTWTYTLSNPTGFRLAIDCPEGVAVSQIHREIPFCNTMVPINPDRFLLLTATNAHVDPADVAIRIFAEGEENPATEGVGPATIIRVKAVTARVVGARGLPPPQLSSPVTPPRAAVSPPASRLPDLVIRIIDVGTTTSSAKEFFPAAAVTTRDIAAVLLEVSNVGAATSPEWKFSAELPIFSPSFTSALQPQLSAGGRVRFIVGFSGLAATHGEYVATFLLDPGNAIRELREDNNNAVVRVNVRD